MKGLPTLIKLRKRELDELRRQMASLEEQKARLQEASAKLHRDLQEEIKLASKQAEMVRFFGDFAKKTQARQMDIAGEIRQLDKQMLEVNDKIAEAFAELKKFEIVQQNIEKRAADAEQRRENNALDEIAGQQHQRRKNEGE